MSAPEPPTPVGGVEESGTRQRLQRISRHFLSDEGAIRRIAVLMDPEEPHALPVEGLARALAGLGCSVAVIDMGAGLLTLTLPVSPSGQEPEPPERILARLRGGRPPELLLLPAPLAAADIASCDLALLAVPAQARGMRSAYLGLKALARRGRLPPIGVTLTGAPTPAEAAAAFGKFAVAAQRFLDIRITSYACVAVDANGEAGRGVAASSLKDIARLLLADGRDPDRHRHDGVETRAAALGFY